jgi:hypothetical protein
MATLDEPSDKRLPLWLPRRVLQQPEVTQIPELKPKKVLLSPPTLEQPERQPAEDPIATLFEPPPFACAALPIATLLLSAAAQPENKALVPTATLFEPLDSQYPAKPPTATLQMPVVRLSTSPAEQNPNPVFGPPKLLSV